MSLRQDVLRSLTLTELAIERKQVVSTRHSDEDSDEELIYVVSALYDNDIFPSDAPHYHPRLPLLGHPPDLVHLHGPVLDRSRPLGERICAMLRAPLWHRGLPPLIL